MKYTIGVDMGGTNTDIGLVTENGNIVKRRNLPTNAYTELEPYVRDMMREIEAMMEEQRTVDGEAIGTQSLFQAYLRPSFGRTLTDVDDAERTDEILDAATIFINNQAAVQPRDSGGINFISAANAMLYYMDDVIHPLAEPMVDRLEQLGEYSIFAAAARDCGYDKVVNKIRDTIRVQGGGTSVRTYNFTCFAKGFSFTRRRYDSYSSSSGFAKSWTAHCGAMWPTTSSTRATHARNSSRSTSRRRSSSTTLASPARS